MCTFAVMELIEKYFHELSERQLEQMRMLDGLYHEWNEKINVISRRDIDSLYEHHVLHSLAIARMIRFRPGTKILDLGTGGGFPGIPLAIVFPECHFTLIDGTGKKIRVAQEIIQATKLTNCTAVHRRGEEERGEYDFVVSRAVMPLADLYVLVKKNIIRTQRNALPNGIICLKGGNVKEETGPFKRIVDIEPVSQWFSEPWFKEKYCLFLPV